MARVVELATTTYVGLNQHHLTEMLAEHEGDFLLMQHVVRRRGIPVAMYGDQHSIFQHFTNREPTLEEQLAGERRPTQFGRLLSESGCTLILARSPQAKGRVERLSGTFQDGLTSELRLAGASKRAHADQVLARYLPRHNKRFATPAVDPSPACCPRRRRFGTTRCSHVHSVPALSAAPGVRAHTGKAQRTA